MFIDIVYDEKYFCKIKRLVKSKYKEYILNDLVMLKVFGIQKTKNI